MHKKSYFLITFLTSISFTILANNGISSRVIAAQEEYILSKLIEMHNDKQMTKENLDTLKNAMQIESFEKILAHKRELLLPTIKSHTWTAVKGLFHGFGSLMGFGLTNFLVRIHFNLLNTNQLPKKTKKYLLWLTKIFQENTKFSIAFVLFATFLISTNCYCLQKIYYQERDRRNTLKIINEIIKELKQLEIT